MTGFPTLARPLTDGDTLDGSADGQDVQVPAEAVAKYSAIAPAYAPLGAAANQPGRTAYIPLSDKLHWLELDAREYGVVAVAQDAAGPDQSGALQNAMLAAVREKRRLVLPEGDIRVGDTVHIPDSLQMSGVMGNATRIVHMPNVSTPMFDHGSGTVGYVVIENLALVGNGYTAQVNGRTVGPNIFQMEARLENGVSLDSAVAGAWYWYFHNLLVYNITGCGWLIKGSTNQTVTLDDGTMLQAGAGYRCPAQFITFHNVRAYRASRSDYSRIVSTRGQCGQIDFIGTNDLSSTGSGLEILGGFNLVFGREFVDRNGVIGDAGDTLIYGDAGWTPTSDNASY